MTTFETAIQEPTLSDNGSHRRRPFARKACLFSGLKLLAKPELSHMVLSRILRQMGQKTNAIRWLQKCEGYAESQGIAYGFPQPGGLGDVSRPDQKRTAGDNRYS